MSGDHLPSSDPKVKRKIAAPPNAEWRSNKGARVDDAACTITGDALIVLHRNFYIPNDVMMIVPLRAGLHFHPPAELVEILKRCGVSLSQFSYRAMPVTVGMIVLFRDREALLTPEHLSRMGRLTSDT
ncbi:hypothetical protein IEQ34_004688 [Dendrobium chrysotoxum]|uniref:Uncharacterized protein n=1 Tax=Dendrobium chrysotoxum TaxID=161865 RepID=A0AAV7HJG8_DENCH|nr:hypothetical protein IEQ34_004688 [Dendrobium chrysotoxum]